MFDQYFLEVPAEPKLWYASDNITIKIDFANAWLDVDWTGLQKDRSVRCGCALILEAVRAHGLRSILNDNSNVKSVWLGAATWLADEWFLALAEAAVKRFAWIRTGTVDFCEPIATTIALLREKPNNMVETFETKEEAVRWLSPSSLGLSLDSKLGVVADRGPAYEPSAKPGEILNHLC